MESQTLEWSIPAVLHCVIVSAIYSCQSEIDIATNESGHFIKKGSSKGKTSTRNDSFSCHSSDDITANDSAHSHAAKSEITANHSCQPDVEIQLSKILALLLLAKQCQHSHHSSLKMLLIMIINSCYNISAMLPLAPLPLLVLPSMRHSN